MLACSLPAEMRPSCGQSGMRLWSRSERRRHSKLHSKHSTRALKSTHTHAHAHTRVLSKKGGLLTERTQTTTRDSTTPQWHKLIMLTTELKQQTQAKALKTTTRNKNDGETKHTRGARGWKRDDSKYSIHLLFCVISAIVYLSFH